MGATLRNNDDSLHSIKNTLGATSIRNTIVMNEFYVGIVVLHGFLKNNVYKFYR